jgi:hypothetical protein
MMLVQMWHVTCDRNFCFACRDVGAACLMLQVLPLVLERTLDIVERIANAAAANAGCAVFDIADGENDERHSGRRAVLLPGLPVLPVLQ